MLVRTAAIVLSVLLAGQAAYGQKKPAAMKGYQLFTWQEKGHWHYSLLPGTNRERTYDEITASATVIVGTSAFESELKRLPKGSEVFWQSDAPPKMKRPASGEAISIKHPSRKRIERIKALCAKLGITVTLV
jgi:hypothetical protein